MREVHEYIVGPDMGADEECMAWVLLRAGQGASVEEFPATVTGKLQKFRMREIAPEKIGQGVKGQA